MNKKLYVGNLPSVAEENQLQALFGADGRAVVSVKIVIDSKTKRSRGYAFVEMATEGDADRAIEALHGREFLGRPLTVNEARESQPQSRDDISEEDLKSPLGQAVFGARGGNRGGGSRGANGRF